MFDRTKHCKHLDVSLNFASYYTKIRTLISLRTHARACVFVSLLFLYLLICYDQNTGASCVESKADFKLFITS